LPAPVYSTLFYSGAPSSSGEQQIYVVPLDKVAVVRDLSWYNDHSADAELFVVIEPGASILYASGAQPSHQFTHYEGRQVVPGGSSINTIFAGGVGRIRVCGYLLDA